MASSDSDEEVPGASDLSIALKGVQQRAVAAAEKRARLPQPLFWNAFHQELKELREAKRMSRLADELLSK